MARQSSVVLYEDLPEAYGQLFVGHSSVLLVAPHAAETHEAGVGDLTLEVAEATGASAIVSYVPRRLFDLNNFHALERVNAPAIEKYKRDLASAISGLLAFHGRAVVIFVHFTPREYKRSRLLHEQTPDGKVVKRSAGLERDYDVDLGCGWAIFSNGGGEETYFPAAYLYKDCATGVCTMDRETTESVRRIFEGKQLRTMVGREWAALNLANMVQVVKADFPAAQVFQLEIVNEPKVVGRARLALVEAIRFLNELVS
jgi:hypothetical protein